MAEAAPPPQTTPAADAAPASSPHTAETLRTVMHNATSATATGTQESALPGDGTLSWGGYFQAVGTLFLLLGLFCLLVWLLRKYGKFNFLPQSGSLPRNALRLEAQLPLGPRKGVMVVRFLDKRLLLGVTDQRITLLTETDLSHEHDSTEFQSIMDAEQRRKTDG